MLENIQVITMHGYTLGFDNINIPSTCKITAYKESGPHIITIYCDWTELEVIKSLDYIITKIVEKL
jgi:hypothetical protein